MLSKISFVLVKPQLGENIGATARALKNFNFSNLILVSPRDGWPNKKAEATSANASDIIKKTKKFLNIKKALKEFNVVFSFSARERDINKKHLNITEFIKILNNFKTQKIGLVFGPESSGLSNDDLSYSNYIVKIPTSKYCSINLSHSVLIVCYEIFKSQNLKSKTKNKNTKISKKRDLFKFTDLLIKLLTKKNFFRQNEKRKSMVQNLNNLFFKLELNNKELRILASIVSTLSKKNF